MIIYTLIFFFQAEDGIRDLVRSRGLGDVYKRQKFGYGLHDYLELDDVSGYEFKPDETGQRTSVVEMLSLIHI